MVCGHIERLRATEEYKSAHIEVFIEGNMSWITANMVAEWLIRKFPRVRCAKDRVGRFGIHTGEMEKQNYAESIQLLLMDDRLHFADTVVSRDWPKYKNDLIEQMRIFRREVREPKDAGFNQPKISYTGKGPGVKDDLILALQIANYWLNKMRCNMPFVQYYHNLGIPTGGTFTIQTDSNTNTLSYDSDDETDK